MNYFLHSASLYAHIYMCVYVYLYIHLLRANLNDYYVRFLYSYAYFIWKKEKAVYASRSFLSVPMVLFIFSV